MDRTNLVSNMAKFFLGQNHDIEPRGKMLLCYE